MMLGCATAFTIAPAVRTAAPAQVAFRMPLLRCAEGAGDEGADDATPLPADEADDEVFTPLPESSMPQPDPLAAYKPFIIFTVMTGFYAVGKFFN